MAIAVTCGDVKMTYEELNRRSDAVAAHLRDRGVTNESIVGLCLERSAELVVALLGILKAGGAYLPIDLAYPPDRLAFMPGGRQGSGLPNATSFVGSLARTQR